LLWVYTTKEISVYASSEEEMLDEGHYFELTHIVEQLVELILALDVQNHVSPEHEDSCGQDGQDLQAFETNDSVKDKVDLVYFEEAYKAVHHPREYSL
jgi:hypothetical protein